MVQSSPAGVEIVAAKLRPPRAQRPLVPRPRLVETTRGRPVLSVVADAGYGKSSFLAQWAAAYPSVIWYSLDERDRDPTTFGQHLLTAAGSPEHEVSDWRARGEAAAGDLAERLLKRLGADGKAVALVLDDYHAVAGVSTIAATVENLLRDRPESLRVGVASRTPVELRLSRLRAHAVVADLGPADLRFTRQEMVAALGIDFEHLASDQASALYAVTDGWPAAVQLLGDAWATGGAPLIPSNGDPRSARRLATRGTPDNGFDAFVEEEILPHLSAEDVEVLARLSLVYEVQRSSSGLVADDPEAFARVQRLAARFSFITRVGDDSFRIHQLVRACLPKRLSSADRRATLERAAQVFAELNQPIEAGWIAIELDDAPRLSDLIKREARRLIAEGRAPTLADWFRHLPEASIEADPLLVARRAHLLAEQGDVESAARDFERAVARLIEAGKSSAAGDTLRVLAGIFEQRGDYARAREVLTRAAALLSDADPSFGVPLWSQIAILRLHDGDPDGAEGLARAVIERLEAKQADDQMLGIAYHNLAHILDMRGRLRASVVAYQRALELKRRQGLEASQTLSLNGLGVVYYRQRRFDLAEPTLREAETLARARGVPLIASYALSNLGDVFRDRGEVDRAADAYRQSLAQKEALGSSYALAYTWNSLAELYRRTGDLAQAEAFNARALALRVDEAGPIERQLYRAEAGRIALSAGDFARAVAELEPATAELRRLGCDYFALHAAWSAATATLRLNGAPACADLVEMLAANDMGPLDDRVAEAPDLAVSLWVSGVRYPALSAALSRHHTPVLDELARLLAQPGVTHVEELLSLLSNLPGNAPLMVLASVADRFPAAESVLASVRANPAPALEVVGFGGLHVARRGQPIPERAWRRQRSIDLLGLLLLAGPGGRTRDELILECWPDASPVAGVSQFHANLHALRAALEPEAARGTSRYVLGDGRTYRLAFELVQSWDVGAFTSALAHARDLEPVGAERSREGKLSDDVVACERAYGEASALYRGDLFSGLTADGTWLEEAQERFRRQAVDARVRLAQLREASGDPSGARSAWESVLALDPLREDAHRAVMRILHSQGQREAALAQFRIAAATLERELGVSPGPETRALYDQLLRS